MKIGPNNIRSTDAQLMDLFYMLSFFPDLLVMLFVDALYQKYFLFFLVVCHRAILNEYFNSSSSLDCLGMLCHKNRHIF